TGSTVDSTTNVEDLELVGITGQDWVQPIAQTSKDFLLNLRSSIDVSEFEYGKVWFCKAFSFGVEPSIGPPWTRSRERRVEKLKPLKGYEEYDVDTAFQMTWTMISRDKLLEFEALPLNWALGVYDDTGDVFSHQLEHMIIAEPW